MSSTLNAFARDAKHLGGTPGFSAVLHTWTRQMAYHPHLHVIMPGVVLSEDGLNLHRKGTKYLFPVRALAAGFRHRLMKPIMSHDQAEATRHVSQIDPHVWRTPWVVDSRGVGNGQAAVRYLARYVNKEHRLLGYDTHGNLRLNCQSSATGEWSVLTLTTDEFLRRWCQHILPKGLMRVRHYGFLGSEGQARTPAPHPLRTHPTATARTGAARHQVRLLCQAHATRRPHRSTGPLAADAQRHSAQARPPPTTP